MMKKENTNQLLTEGKPYKKIVQFTLPILIGSLFQQLYNMADAFIISRTLGVEAFAGVSSTGGIIFLILGFAQGMTSGLAIPLAQSFGAGNYEHVKRHYAHNIIVSIIFALLLTGVSLGMLEWMLAELRTPVDIYPFAHDYLRVMFWGILMSMMFNFFADSLRALGDSKSPLYFLLMASALNIVLDIIFIRVVHMGVEGAALATVLAQGVSAGLCFIRILRKVKILSLANYQGGLQLKTALNNLKLGLPMAFQSSIIALGVIIMQFATNNMGTIAVAAYAVAAKIDGIAVEPLRALGVTMTTYTAQNYGAGKYKRVREGVRQSVIISVLLSLLLGAIMLFGGRILTQMFIGNVAPLILDNSHTFLIIHGVLYIILGLLFIFRYTLQGLGYTFIPTVAGTMELIMRVIAAFFLVPTFEFAGASFATPLSWTGALLPVAIAYYFAAGKLHKKNTDVYVCGD